jgi:hypothetical protein
MTNNFEEGQGSQRAVVPVIMMMMMMMNCKVLRQGFTDPRFQQSIQLVLVFGFIQRYGTVAFIY